MSFYRLLKSVWAQKSNISRAPVRKQDSWLQMVFNSKSINVFWAVIDVGSKAERFFWIWASNLVYSLWSYTNSFILNANKIVLSQSFREIRTHFKFLLMRTHRQMKRFRAFSPLVCFSVTLIRTSTAKTNNSHNPQASYLLAQRAITDGGFEVSVRCVVD